MRVSQLLLAGVAFSQCTDGLATRAPQDDAIEAASAASCQKACSFLTVLLKGKVSLPQSSIYETQQAGYWSAQQSSQTPACRIAPRSAADVSVALLVLRAQNCKFAVKSGGHASFAGASNIDSAVVFDLVNLNSVTVSADKKQVAVQTGARWGQVYSQIAAQGVAVVGGRNADIGSGGLTLGGGISFFSGRYGWACDNVNNYQVVFADGTIRDVNLKSYSDLFWALRGGGNNFGIVTRLDLVAIKHGDMWGGSFSYDAKYMPDLIDAFTNFNINHEQDPDAAVILSFAYVGAFGFYVAGSNLEYLKPVANAPILKSFTNVPTLFDTRRITNLTDLTLELAATQPPGARETFWAFMIHNNAALMKGIQDIWTSEIDKVKGAAGILPALVFQPISTAMTSHFTQNGGNALGITVADGPLTLINTSIKWDNITDDASIIGAAENFVKRSTALAKQAKLDHPFIYQNYAAIQQDVFSGYGAKSKARLIAIHKKYDPSNVFTKLQPGYFKVPS